MEAFKIIHNFHDKQDNDIEKFKGDVIFLEDEKRIAELKGDNEHDIQFIDNIKKDELLDYAQEKGFEVDAKMTKQEIIEVMLNGK